MYRRTGAVFASIIISTAVFFSSANEIKIGSCLLSNFIFGGQNCIREMIRDLKKDPDMLCSVGYNELKTCLSDHVTYCVRGDPILQNVRDQITNLLLIEAYHCGNQIVNVSDINPLLLRTIKCMPDRLNEAFACWNGFHSVFNNSRNSPELCNKYFEAKRDCVEVVRRGCQGLCPYIFTDAFNPFCPNNADPVVNTPTRQACSELHKQCSTSFIYEKAMECEDQGAQMFADSPAYDCVQEEERSRTCLRNKLGNCSNLLTSITRVVEPDVATALNGILTNRRMFCAKTDLVTTSLSSVTGTLQIDCKDEEFSEAAENCVKDFRDNFKVVTTTESLRSSRMCSDYAGARNCKNDAQKTYCSLQEDVNDITAAIKNPFCPSGAVRPINTALSLFGLTLIFYLIVA